MRTIQILRVAARCKGNSLKSIVRSEKRDAADPFEDSQMVNVARETERWIADNYCVRSPMPRAPTLFSSRISLIVPWSKRALARRAKLSCDKKIRRGNLLWVSRDHVDQRRIPFYRELLQRISRKVSLRNIRALQFDAIILYAAPSNNDRFISRKIDSSWRIHYRALIRQFYSLYKITSRRRWDAARLIVILPARISVLELTIVIRFIIACGKVNRA